MKGVTILNATEITGIDIKWFFIPLILFIIAIIAYEIADANFNYQLKSVALFVTILGFVSVIILGAADLIIPSGKYEYEVTIDDNVSMKEFNEHYEIQEQRGEIYVVKEK